MTVMKSISTCAIMGLVHIADLFDKPPATKGIDAWKYFLDNQYQGYNHVLNIALSVYRSSAS